GAGVWVTESPDKPELILEHNLPALQILVEGVVAKGINTNVRRCAREGTPLVVPPQSAANHETLDAPANPTPFELLLAPLRFSGIGGAAGAGAGAGMVLLLAVPAEERDSRA